MDAAPPCPEQRCASLTPRAQAEAEARRVREAAALRENLRKRKLQARARDLQQDQTHPDSLCR